MSELKKRKVLHAIAVYAVAALAVLQFAEYAFEAAGAPGWAFDFVVLASIAGLMITPVIAWTYDLTKRGFVRVTPSGLTLHDVGAGQTKVSRATLVVAAALSVGAFVALYGPAYRDLAVVGTISKADAAEISRAFMTDMGASGSFGQIMRRHNHTDGLTFAQSELGLREARSRADALAVVSWEMRWYQSGEVEDWRVEVGGEGDILRFEHTLEENAEGATLEQEEARALALEFLASREWSEGDLRQTSASSSQQPNRTDHTFDWDVVPGQIERGEGEGEPGKVQITATVAGDALSAYHVRFAVPDDFQRARSQQGSVELLLVFGGMFLLGLWALIRLVIHFRRGDLKELQWKAPLITGAGFLFALLLVLITDQSDMIFTLDASGSFLVERAGQSMFLGFLFIVIAAVFTLLVGVTQALAGLSLPGQLEGYRALMRGDFADARVQAETSHGMLLAFILLAFALTENLIVGAFPQVWAFSETLWGGFAGYAPPVLGAFAEGVLQMALVIVLLFFVTLLYDWTKSKGVAVLLAATIPSFAVHSVEPVSVGGTLAAIGLLVLLAGLMGWGLWAAMFGTFAAALFVAGGHMIASGLASLQVQGAIAIALGLLPWLLIARVGGSEVEGELVGVSAAGR